MGEAPKPRDMRSTFGKSLGVAVQGIMPEVYRNRPKADPANQSGSPWPDAPGDVVTTFTATDAGSLDGTSDSFVMPFTLPSEGLWLLIPTVFIVGYVTLSAGDVAKVDLELRASSSAFHFEIHDIAVPYYADADPHSPFVNFSWGYTYPYATDSVGDSVLDLEVAALVSGSSGNTADWQDVDVSLSVRCVRLTTEWVVA